MPIDIFIIHFNTVNDMQNVLNAFYMKWVISIEMKKRLSAITLERLTEEEKQTLSIAVATVLCRSNI